jgi:hypothetical protein
MPPKKPYSASVFWYRKWFSLARNYKNYMNLKPVFLSRIEDYRQVRTGLNLGKVEINTKMLSYLSVHEPATFSHLTHWAKEEGKRLKRGGTV